MTFDSSFYDFLRKNFFNNTKSQDIHLSEVENTLKKVENLSDSDITIDDIAQAVGMSRTSLHRKMKQLMGTSPMEFLREARIRKAVKMLETTSKNVSEIAYQCGFSDPKYFSKCFKSTFGQTPSEYKQNQSQ